MGAILDRPNELDLHIAEVPWAGGRPPLHYLPTGRHGGPTLATAIFIISARSRMSL